MLERQTHNQNKLSILVGTKHCPFYGSARLVLSATKSRAGHLGTHGISGAQCWSLLLADLALSNNCNHGSLSDC